MSVEKSYLDFPFGIGSGGGLQVTNTYDHIRDEILAVLLTSPGERVNLPDFGCGLKEYIFAPNVSIVATMIDLKISQSLDRWLGEKITVNEINVRPIEERLLIDVYYTIKNTAEESVISLTL